MAESSITDWIQALIGFLQLILSGFGIYYVIKSFQQGARNLEIANQNIALANQNNKLQLDTFKNSIRPHFELVTPTNTETPYGKFAWHTFAFTVSQHDALNVNFLAYSTEYINFLDAKTHRIENSWFLTRMKIGDRVAMYIMVNSRNRTDAELNDLKRRYPREFKIEIHVTFSDAMGNSYTQSVRTTIDNVNSAIFDAPKPTNWDEQFE